MGERRLLLNAEGIGYSDDTIRFGTYDASLDQLEQLEGEVTVEVTADGAPLDSSPVATQ